MLPNLLIIGSAKAGTTSLHHYLDQHPDVFMARPDGQRLEGCERAANDARPKEMRFFWRDDWRERLPWYERHFDVPHQVRGEATPAYSAHPFHPHVAERVYATVPGAKLIYLVRDPIDRIVAHYVQLRVDGDARSFAERLRDYERPDHPIVCPSLYATQVERYLEGFPSSQLLVIDQHELRHARPNVLRRVFEFLGVDPNFDSPAFEVEQNTRDDKLALGPRAYQVYSRLDGLGRRVTPSRWELVGPAVRRTLSQPLGDRPVVEPELRRRLTRLLAPEVHRLRGLTGHAFESWSM